MKNVILLSALLIIAAIVSAQQSKFLKLTGPYLGQTPPDTTPIIFAPGVVSLSGSTEYSSTFSPDGREYYFYRFSNTMTATIYFSKMSGEEWTNPEPVGFSSGHAAYEPHITFDNLSLYFSWNTGSGLPGIWVTKRVSENWSAPTYAGQGMFVSSDSMGNIYLTDLSSYMSTGKTYLAKVTVNNDIFTNYQRLNISNHYGSQAHPCIAPDGSYLIFDVQGGSYMYICFKKQDGTWGEAIDLTKLGFNPSAGGATISPDDKYLFFCLNQDIWWVSTKVIEKLRPAKGTLAYAITPPDGNAEIFLMNADGSEKTQLTNETGKPYGPAFSPDTTKIAFYNHLNDQTWSLYMMNADGGNIQQLTNASDTLDWSPDWSPDGSKIVFARSYPSPVWRSEVWMINPDGTDLHKVSDVDGQGPDWSPDGSKIVYFNYIDGGGDIWVMNADGTNPIKLTDNPSEDWWPKFSPDGSKIAFQSKRDGNHEIYIMNNDGSNPLRLTNNLADDEDPNWSPDGTKIAFISMRDGHYEIYTMNADGSNQTRITNTDGHAIDPDWKPIIIPDTTVIDDSISVNIHSGWNMISIPIDSIYLASDLITSPTSKAFYYDPDSAKYIVEDTLKSGNGYWLKFSSDGIMKYFYDSTFADTINVKEGWNMIGSISTPVPVTALISDPPGMTTSNFFTYESGYIMTDIILPGIGYWVKVDQPGLLILSASENIPTKNWIQIIQGEEMPPTPPPSEEMVEKNKAIPTRFELMQNYPNPFNPTTTIRYQLPVDSRVILKIYNILGQVVETLVDEVQNAGYKSVELNIGNLASGVYFYRLTAESEGKSFVAVKKLLLMK